MADYYNPEVQQIFPDSCAIKFQQRSPHNKGLLLCAVQADFDIIVIENKNGVVKK